MDRIELYVHTNMSDNSGINTATDYIKKAADMGSKAIAITDFNSVQAYPEAMEAGKKYGIKIIYGVEIDVIDVDKIVTAEVMDENGYLYTKLIYPKETPKSNRMLVYAKNKKGITSIYKLITESYGETFYESPKVRRSSLTKYRDDLLICPSIPWNELSEAIALGEDKKKIIERASFYDFLTIDDSLFGIDDLKINQQIIELGEELDKLVVFLEEITHLDTNASLSSNIISSGYSPRYLRFEYPPSKKNYRKKRQLKQFDKGKYLKSVEKIIELNSYFFESRVNELIFMDPSKMSDYISVENFLRDRLNEIIESNTNKINDLIEDIDFLPKEKLKIKIENADKVIKEIVIENARDKYGGHFPEIIQNRINKELDWIIKNENASIFLIISKIANKNKEQGYPMGILGTLGSSFVAYLIGAPEVNPLPPHYICIDCKSIEFVESKKYYSGFDLPNKKCPNCSTDYKKDGHNIPPEMFFGIDGKKEPDISLAIPDNNIDEIRKLLVEYININLGKDKIYRCGKTEFKNREESYKSIEKYVKERKNLEINKTIIDDLVSKTSNKKSINSIYEEGLLILPKDVDIYDYTPLESLIDSSELQVTHIDYRYLTDYLVKLDLVKNRRYSILKDLVINTGIELEDIDLSDPEVLSLFSSTRTLDFGSQLSMENGMLGAIDGVFTYLKNNEVKSFSDVIKLFGLYDFYKDNKSESNSADFSGRKPFEEVFAQDDVFVDLVKSGLDRSLAYEFMNTVKFGRALKPEQLSILKKLDIPKGYLERICQINYLFPKSHLVEEAIQVVRLAWFKLYHPKIWKGNPYLDNFTPNKTLSSKHTLYCHFFSCDISMFYWGYVS